MESLVSFRDHIYETVSRDDEALERFLETFDEMFNACNVIFKLIVPSIWPETAEHEQKSTDQLSEAYLAAKEKYKTEPKKILDWLFCQLGIPAK